MDERTRGKLENNARTCLNCSNFRARIPLKNITEHHRHWTLQDKRLDYRHALCFCSAGELDNDRGTKYYKNILYANNERKAFAHANRCQYFNSMED